MLANGGELRALRYTRDPAPAATTG